jgi:NADH-quinone oxidoreductase subunit M
MILGAVYMLYAYQRIMLGEIRTDLVKKPDLRLLDYFFLLPLIMILLGLGVYPQPIFNLVETAVVGMQNLLIPLADVASAVAN